jgi:hypothetical protein
MAFFRSENPRGAGEAIVGIALEERAIKSGCANLS